MFLSSFFLAPLTHAQTPPPGCPIFLNTTPRSPFDTDDITLVFRNDSGSSYYVKIDKDNSKIFNPTPINGTSVQIGSYREGSHSFEFFLYTTGSDPLCGTNTFTIEKTPTTCTATIPQTTTMGEPFMTTIDFPSAFTGQAKLEFQTADGLPAGTGVHIFNISQTQNIEIPGINRPGKYRMTISSLRPSKLLCISNAIDVVASATPTPGPTITPGGPTLTPVLTPASACTPPGKDPSTGRCLDNNCILSFSNTCIQPGVVLPTSAPARTAPSLTPTAPPFPCEQKDGRNCKAVKTAIGNITTDPAEFIKTIFTVLLSMAGGWATYLFITAGYQLMFSQGDPENVKEAHEKITSALVGLVFMILSIGILRVIGLDIFGLPTFKP